MKTIIITLLLGISLCFSVGHAEDNAFLNHYEQYRALKNNIHPENYPEIIEFIELNTPLAQKLRKRWLYHLAKKRDWDGFYFHYKPQSDKTLKCYYHLAQAQNGQKTQAFDQAKSLWLTAATQPHSCQKLFAMWMKDESFDKEYIYQRLKIALETKNLKLARRLIKKLNQEEIDYTFLIPFIHNQPHRIETINIADKKIEAMLTLYGLKRITVKDIDKSLRYWLQHKIQGKLSTAQQQSYLKHLTLYMAMRNHKEVDLWFDKVKPEYYTDPHLEWQIRAGLKNKRWLRVKSLINRYRNKHKPCWRYWYARALEASDSPDEAKQIYQEIAKTRHYYGFLASHRLQQPLSFQDISDQFEAVDMSKYDGIIEEIKTNFEDKKMLTAALKLNDLSTGLSNEEIRELAKHVASWQWHHRAIYLISKTPFKDDLSLRFPMAYKELVRRHSKAYGVPPEFIYAIMRQESTFRKAVVSSAGARGLMQLMPRTAYLIARKHRIPYRHKKQLFTPYKNIQIGTAYLKRLSKRFKKHPILMAAAYNAGPLKVREWMREHKPNQMDIWIETLPWRETRNYLKNVTSNFAVYQYRLYGKSNLTPILRHFRQ